MQADTDQVREERFEQLTVQQKKKKKVEEEVKEEEGQGDFLKKVYWQLANNCLLIHFCSSF